MSSNKYKQGDLVWLKIENVLPDGKVLKHPYLIISSDMSNSYECFYTGVMLTSNPKKDRFTFECKSEMFEASLNKEFQQLRMYITASFREADISELMNRINSTFIDPILDQIKKSVFCK
jgi:hypothetical protein